MKKIVGILAAAAVAASVFAVDIGTMIHGWTNLFSMDLATSGSQPQFLGVRDPFDRKYAWYSTGMGISVNADKCGGYFELNGRDVAVENVKVYFQPIDALKLTVGKIGLATNAETIDYTKLAAYEDGREGWALDITPVEGLTINTMFVTGAARSWGWKFWGENGKIGETVAKIGYSADFGSIFAMVDYADPVTQLSAGYSGKFGSINAFADVAFKIADKANELGVDLFLDGSADAFGYKVYAKYTMGIDAKTNAVLAKARVQYRLDQGTVYCGVRIPDAMAAKFPVQIYPGFEFNIGAASIDAGVQFNLNTDFDANYSAGALSVNVPVIYRVVF